MSVKFQEYKASNALLSQSCKNLKANLEFLPNWRSYITLSPLKTAQSLCQSLIFGSRVWDGIFVYNFKKASEEKEKSKHV